MRLPAEIRTIESPQTVPLRSSVLRPGRPIEAAIFPNDNAPDTTHLGVFVDDRLIAIASVFPEALPRESPSVSAEEAATRAWRLRAVAVAPDMQGQGYGSQLLEAALKHVAERGAALLWCNARSSAKDFYLANGFETCGDEFIIPDVGPHFIMLRRVE